MTRCPSCWRFALAAVLAWLAPLPIRAQTPASAAPPQPAPAASTALPQVTVTAVLTHQVPFDIPASVDVTRVPAEGTLDVNPSQVLAGIPGVLARDRQNYAQDEQISIRGFGARAPFGIRGIRLYTDGIPATMPDGQGQISHFNLDTAARIEVLRGPFSALYGNDSGGVISLFTADGTRPSQVSMGVAGGSDGVLRARAEARGKNGDMGYNIGFTHFRTDGYRDHSRAQKELGNAKLDWDLDGGRRLTLVVNTFNLPGAQDPQGLTPAQFHQNPRQASTPAVPYDTRKSASQQQAGLIYEDPVSDNGTLRLMGYYGQRKVLQFLSIPTFAEAAPLSSGGVVDLHNDYGGVDARWTWSGTLAGRPAQVVVGTSYDNENEHRRGYDNFVGSMLGVRGLLRRNEQNRVYDFDQYAQGTWRVSRDWSLMAGVRHSRVAFRSHDYYITATNPDDSGRKTYTATTPVAGVMWRLSPEAHLYAAWGEGFETPTFAELSYRTDGVSGLALYLRPARIRSTEVGLKLRPVPAVRANLALFRADSRHELAVASNTGGRTTYHNIDRARRQGAEASFEADLGGTWRAHADYTWLDATYRSPYLTCTDHGCNAPSTRVPAGSLIPGVPRSNGYAALSWGGATGWTFKADGTWMAAVPVNDLNTVRAPAYTLFDVGGGYAFDSGPWHTRLFARIDNVFGRHYVGSVRVDDGNQRYFEPGPGRTFIVGIDLRRTARD